MTIALVIAVALGVVGGCAGFIQPAKPKSAPAEESSRPTPSATPTAAPVAAPTAVAERPAAARPAPTAPARPTVLIARPTEAPAALDARHRALVTAGRSIPRDEVGYYLDVLVARLRQLQIAGLTVVRHETRVSVDVVDSTMFESATAVLTADARRTLGPIARLLNEYDRTVISIHGQVDFTGAAVTDQRLAEQRALAVALQFTGGGVAVGRIIVVGNPADPAKAVAEVPATNGRIILWLDPLRQ
ncbi:MAG: OmpA family protein [Gemmatimonadaceae bacterium]